MIMKKDIRIMVFTVLFIVSFQLKGTCMHPKKDADHVKVTIIYDNYNFKDGLKSDWGFSCLIEGSDKTILFDTGSNRRVFKQNFEALGIPPESIDLVVISHDHFDHIGGLNSFLEINNDVSVYMMKSFSEKIKKKVVESGCKVHYAPQITEICRNVYLSGTLGKDTEEQSLAINTDKGLVVVTGCSHPGINKILKHFKESLQKDIYMVIGGFHLMRMNDDEMNNLISEMKDLGVQKCGATHCTGKAQIEMFKNAFNDNYINMGVGNEIVF